MRNKMMLIATEISSADKILTASGDGVVKLKTDSSEGTIKSLVIQGQPDIDKDPSLSGVGHYESGTSVVNIRIHGECYLDGKELIRLMEACNSPAYGGETDDGCFIYNASDTDTYTVVSTDHMMLEGGVNTLRMTAVLESDIKNGGPLVPGLHFKKLIGASIAISSDTSGVGECEMKGALTPGSRFGGLIHLPVESAMSLPIITDSVRLYHGTEIGDEGYNGFTVTQHLGKPLLGIPSTDVCDEIECISGTITRRVGSMTLDEDTPLYSVTYEGYECYLIKLERKTDAFMLYLRGFLQAHSADRFEDDISCCLADPDGSELILYPGKPGVTEAEMRKMILSKTLLYSLSEPYEEKVESVLDGKLNAGYNTVEICSHITPTVIVNYEIKE